MTKIKRKLKKTVQYVETSKLKGFFFVKSGFMPITHGVKWYIVIGKSFRPYKYRLYVMYL